MSKNVPVRGPLWRGSSLAPPVQEEGVHDHDLPPGELVLVVQRRDVELAVWREGRPDDVALVPVKAHYLSLRVRPTLWSSAMPVQFTGELGTTTTIREATF